MEDSGKILNAMDEFVAAYFARMAQQNIAMPTQKQMAELRKLWHLTMKIIRDAFSPTD